MDADSDVDVEAPTVCTPPPGDPGTPLELGEAPTAAMPSHHGTGSTEADAVAPTVLEPADAPTKPPSAPPGVDADDSLLGRTLGGCRIKAKIGQGGMGAAYKADHIALEKEVVVKVLPPAYTGSAQLRERFLLEARTTAKLMHGNIVQVYDVGQEDGVCYYVMELVDGENLHELCQRKGPLSYEEATRIVAESARGLAVAHEAGVLHRDIKPTNILITRKGTTKVLDFGLARDVSKEGVTVSGQILGTPHYMSPEQADGAADPRSDLYSLGITYFWLLTNRLPFVGSGTLSIVLKQMTQRPPPLRKFLPDAPLSICAVVERLLRKDPEERFQTANELVEVLEGIRRELAGGPAVVFLRPSIRPWRFAGLGVLLVALCVGAFFLRDGLLVARDDGVVSFTGPGPSRPSGPDAPPPLDEPPLDAPPVDEPPVVEPPVDEPPVDEPPVDEPPDSAGDPPDPPRIRWSVPAGGVVRETTIRVEGSLEGELDGLKLRANGRPVELSGDRFAVVLEELEDGLHELELSVLWGEAPIANERWSVRVDASPPRLEWVESERGRVVSVEDLPADRSVAVRVRVSGERGPVTVKARIGVMGAPSQPLAQGSDSTFSGQISLRPASGRVWVGRLPLEVMATDEAGNEAPISGELIVVPRGMVLVGSAESGRAGPLAAFFMDRDEVTNARFKAFLQATDTKAPRRFEPGAQDQLPAQFVTYELAVGFAAWCGRRLPVEREWEVAAAWSNGRQTSYPWGNETRRSLDVNVAYCREGAEARPVGASADDVSPWGCRDMAGNVQEWVSVDPADPDGRQAVKGGCYRSRLLQAAEAGRPGDRRAPTLSFQQLGFRCARSLDRGEEVDP